MWRETFRQAPSTGMSLVESEVSFADRCGPILGLVLDLLKSSPFIATFKQDFTLVNMKYAPNNISLGYIETSPKFLDADTGLVFTFALSPCKRKTVWPSWDGVTYNRSIVIWGQRQKFCSVFINRTDLTKLGANALLLPQLRLIYNVVGAATRNYANFGCSLDIPADDQYFHIYRKHGRINTLQQLVDNVPIYEWVYCPVFWSEYSFMLFTKTLPANFGAYWTLYADSDVYRYGMTNDARNLIENTLIQYLRPAIAYLQSVLRSGDVPLKPPMPLVALLALIARSTGNPFDEGRYAEHERKAFELLNKAVFSGNNELMLGGLRTALDNAAAGLVPCLVSGTSNLLTTTFLQLFESSRNASN